MDRSNLLDSALPCSAENESVGDKLRREAHLLLAGISGGFVDAACDSVKPSNLLETTTKVALGIGLGAGLAYLSKGNSLCRTGVNIFGVTALATFAGDVVLNAKHVGGALSDTWQSNDNWNHNLTAVKKTAGQFAFDTALMTAAGITGGALQPKLSTMLKRSAAPSALNATAIEGLATTDPTYPLGFPHQPEAWAVLPTMKSGKRNVSIDFYGAETIEAQLATRYGDSIVRLEVLAPTSPYPFKGTGFFVGKDGTIATCFHVVEHGGGAIGNTCKVNMNGKILTAKIRSVDSANDLALLKVDGLAPEVIQPLPIARATANLAVAEGTLTLGYGSSNCLVASPGKIEVAALRLQEFPKAVGGSPDATFISMESHTVGGASGAPVFNLATGEVIGLHCAGNQSTLGLVRPAEVLRSLMAKPAGFETRVLAPITKGS